jgi:hypothetical protein
MSLRDEIRELFASTPVDKARKIKSLVSPCEAWALRIGSEYGVGIPVAEEVAVSEKFAGARLRTESLVIQGEPKRLLLLSCKKEELRTEFATVCAQFADPAEREQLLASPQEWWERWRNLLGNSIAVKQPYSVLGEMFMLKFLLSRGDHPEWTGCNGGVVDIVTNTAKYEVKSTIIRHETEVTISSTFQLSGSDPLHLIFCRFEQVRYGVSINSLSDQLVALGMSKQGLEQGLEKLGFEEGASAREQTYRLLEMRKYDIDDDFPGITPRSFVGGQLPPGVKHLTYRLDLSNIPSVALC